MRTLTWTWPEDFWQGETTLAARANTPSCLAQDAPQPELWQALLQILSVHLGPSPERPVPRNVVLCGPPGTGKTFTARWAAERLCSLAEGESKSFAQRLGWESLVRFIQFHPNYCYEHFMQGLRPILGARTLRYELCPGSFLSFCRQAQEHPEAYHVFVIDELNRGETARVLGEAIHALEYRDIPIALAGGGSLTVPSNVIVLGTMNTADRGISRLDLALQRRFAFLTVKPQPELILAQRADEPCAPGVAQGLVALNAWLTDKLGEDFCLGHGPFLNPHLPLKTNSHLARVWESIVAPFLGELLRHDPLALKEAARAWERGLMSVSQAP